MRILALVVLVAASFAAAAEPYALLGWTKSDVKVGAGQGFSGDASPMLSLGAGYRFTKHMAVEAAYVDSDDISAGDTTVSATTTVVTTRTYDSSGFGLFAVGTYPATPALTLLAKGGVYLLRTELRTTTISVLRAPPFTPTTLADGTTKESVTAPSIGIGAEYAIGKNVRARALVEHVTGDGSLDQMRNLSFALVVSF